MSVTRAADDGCFLKTSNSDTIVRRSEVTLRAIFCLTQKPEPVLDALAHTEDTVIVVTRSLTANSK